jgi:hypothetical protein
MSRSLKRYLPEELDSTSKIAFTMTTCDIMDLPKFDDTKRLLCPRATTVKDVIEHANDKLSFSRHVIHASGIKFNPFEHIDITLPVILDGKEEFISLPQDLTLGVVHTFLWPLSGLPQSERKESAIPLRYRTLKKKQQKA